MPWGLVRSIPFGRGSLPADWKVFAETGMLQKKIGVLYPASLVWGVVVPGQDESEGCVLARRVLIVDDDADVRLFVRAVMEGEGWQATEARHGEEAVDMVEQDPPDLVILDVGMPVMDGFEAFQRLRKSPHTERVPIIMLTGINTENEEKTYSEDSMEKAFGVNGPEGFVDKPVDATFLLNSIMGVMG